MSSQDQTTVTEAQAKELFLQNLAAIERICAFVCRRNHLLGDDAAEFTQEVEFRLLAEDYAIVRKFEGRSSFTTYLTTVIQRLFHQYRIEQWGKWRPSAEAKRLGHKAITLERLVTRDGLTFHEAVETLITRANSPYTEAELEAIYLRLPARQPRPILVSDEATPESAAAVAAEADHRAEAGDREKAARSTCAVIDRLLSGFPPVDRLILRMRFCEACKVPDIARRLKIDQKKLYKRFEKLCAYMRKELERSGVGRADIDMLLSSGDQELRFDGLRSELSLLGPSHPAGGTAREGGEGRL